MRRSWNWIIINATISLSTKWQLVEGQDWGAFGRTQLGLKYVMDNSCAAIGNLHKHSKSLLVVLNNLYKLQFKIKAVTNAQTPYLTMHVGDILVRHNCFWIAHSKAYMRQSR